MSDINLNEKHISVLKEIIIQSGYLLITFDGATCCGKTTHAKLMADYLSKVLGEEVLFIQNPVKFSEVADKTIDLMLSPDPHLSCMGALTNRICLQKVILDFIKNKTYRVFITDRWNISFWVHQLSVTNLIKDDPTFSLWCTQYPDRIEPQFQFYLEVDKKVLQERLSNTSKVLNKFEKGEFIDKVRDSYESVALPNAKYCIVKVGNESIRDTQNLIKSSLIKRLNYISR